MKKIKLWIIVFNLIVFISFLIKISFFNKTRKFNNNKKFLENSSEIPKFKNEHNKTFIYNKEGVLNYLITSESIEYISENKTSWFIKPILITYDNDVIPVWSVKSDKAKISRNSNILYLYGQIEIIPLNNDFKLKKITTGDTIINLLTQEIRAYHFIKIDGISFHSSGLEMQANLKNKKAEIIGNIKASYEIKNSKNSF